MEVKLQQIEKKNNGNFTGEEPKEPVIQWDKDEPCLLGIDEAGRGPVLGPMVYAASYCPISMIDKLNKLQANDSKQLTEEQRDKLREKIESSSDFLQSRICVLPATELSEKMLRKVKVNLNVISHDAALDLVRQTIKNGVNIKQVFVDTVGTPHTYAEKFRNEFPQLEKVVVEKKADSKFKIVSVASIMAKTTRDKCIKQWAYPEMIRSESNFETYPIGQNDNDKVEFTFNKGSGYPSDPITKKWMENSYDEVFGFPNIVRFSWGTTKTILDKKGILVSWESDEDDDDVKEPLFKQPRVKTKDIKSFFTAPASSNSKSSKASTKACDSSSTKSKQGKQQGKPLNVELLKKMNLKKCKTLI